MTPERIAKRPTIAELEALLNKEEEGGIEIKPDGSVVRLSAVELLYKERRAALEEVEVLRNQAQKLRDGLKRVISELESLLP